MSDLTQRLFEESQDDTESLYWKAWSEIDQLRQQFEQAQEENESFREKLYVSEARIAELEDLIRTAPVESGVCMCGDPMDEHTQAHNHSPVDIWDHTVTKVSGE